MKDVKYFCILNNVHYCLNNKLLLSGLKILVFEHDRNVLSVDRISSQQQRPNGGDNETDKGIRILCYRCYTINN